MKVYSLVMDFPAIDYASKFASQALGQATLGVLLHVSFISIEPEFYVYKFIRLYVAAFIIYLAISVFQAGVSTATAIGAVVLASLTVWCGFLASLSVYRLFFHRLRSFPGPFWARLSKFYAVKAGWKRSQWHRELEKLHEQYGDIVRIGMLNRACHAHCFLALPLTWLNVRRLRVSFRSARAECPHCGRHPGHLWVKVEMS